MEDKILNFSSFFQNAISQYSALPQIDAVNALLCGGISAGSIEREINDALASSYVNGKRAIRKEILKNLFALPQEEIVKRVHMLGIQDIQRAVDASKALVCEAVNLSDTVKKPLLSLAETPGSEYACVAEVFLSAVKCPSKLSTSNDDVTTQPQVSGRPSEQPTLPSGDLNRVPEENCTPLGTITPTIAVTDEIYLDPVFDQYMNDQFKTYSQRNIAVYTPQLLSMVLKYPDNRSLRIFNAFAKKGSKEPYGDYLLRYLEGVDKYYIENGRMYQDDQYNAYQKLIRDGIRNSSDLLKYEDYISSTMFCYFILAYSNGSTVRKIKEHLGDDYETVVRFIRDNREPSIPAYF